MLRLELALLLGLCAATAAAASPPNVLLITCDNLGYGDLPCYNEQSPILAPRLDELAQQGARLTNFYTASPTCTVSRASLLTGRVPQRHGLTRQLAGVAGNYGVGLDPRELLIPQVLKGAPQAYATGCFGKWNIGFAPGSRPTERGFDEFIGHASGNMDYYQHNYREKHDLYRGVEPLHRQGTYATDLFADAAIDFIQRHSATSTPWFCYLPFNAPHFPVAGNKPSGEPPQWQAPDWAFEAYGMTPDEPDPQRRYYAVVYALDRAIGRVLDALQAAGAAEHTLVFFMSDNGSFMLDRQGLDVGSNAPLRSGGVTCWEGGLRVPALVRWPGTVPAGIVVSEPTWSPDVFTACARAAEAPLPDDRVLDGRDPLPVWSGRASSPHRSLYFQFATHAALRMGDWKIVRERPEQSWQLFHLSTDLGESTDLASQRPDRLHALTAEFEAWQQSLSSHSSSR